MGSREIEKSLRSAVSVGLLAFSLSGCPSSTEKRSSAIRFGVSATPEKTVPAQEIPPLSFNNDPFNLLRRKAAVEITFPEEGISNETRKKINDATMIVEFRLEGMTGVCTGVHVGSGKVITAGHCLECFLANGSENKTIVVGHPLYRMTEAKIVYLPADEIPDIGLIKFDLENVPYGAVESGRPEDLKVNQTLIVATYQWNALFAEGAFYAIHFHRVKFLGFEGEFLVVAEGLDQAQKINQASAGGSGGGIYDLRGRLLGNYSGGYGDRGMVEAYAKKVGADPEKIKSISLFTSVSRLPEDLRR